MKFIVLLLEFSTYFEDNSSVRCGVGEDLFPFSKLSFCFIDSVLCLTEPFSFRGSHYELLISVSVLLVLYSGNSLLANVFTATSHFFFYHVPTFSSLVFVFSFSPLFQNLVLIDIYIASVNSVFKSWNLKSWNFHHLIHDYTHVFFFCNHLGVYSF